MSDNRFEPFTLAELRALVSAIVAAQHAERGDVHALGLLRAEAGAALDAKVEPEA